MGASPGRLLLTEVVLGFLGPFVAVGLVVVASWLTAFGPSGAPGWVLDAVEFTCWANVLIVVLFGSVRTLPRRAVGWVLAAISFFASFIAVGSAQDTVDDQAFLDRGRVVTCVITSVDEHTETHRNANGDTETDTSYAHSLSCPGATVGALVTSGPEGKPGDRVRVEYDPTGRLGTQLADQPIDPGGALHWALITALIAACARALRELLPSEPNPFGGRQGMARVRFGVTVGGLILVVALAFCGGYQLARWAATAALHAVGVPRLPDTAWVHVPLAVLTGLVLNAILGLARRMLVWLLRTVRPLDPDGGLAELLVILDVNATIPIPLFGSTLFVDAGFLGFLKKRLVRRRTR